MTQNPHPSDEVPEADAIEQRQSLDGDEHQDPVDPDQLEVPEADAIEQRIEVPEDDRPEDGR